MSRRTRFPKTYVLTSVIQAVICGVGFLGGLAIGTFIIYVSGLWNKLERVLSMSLDSMTMSDLLMAAAPLAIVFGCGWLGTRCGMALAAKAVP